MADIVDGGDPLSSLRRATLERVEVQASLRAGERLFAFERKQALAFTWGRLSCGIQKEENLVLLMPLRELHRRRNQRPWCGEEISHCPLKSKV